LEQATLDISFFGRLRSTDATLPSYTQILRQWDWRQNEETGFMTLVVGWWATDLMHFLWDTFQIVLWTLHFLPVVYWKDIII